MVWKVINRNENFGNPNGYGKVDEYRIFKDGELYQTIVG
jgi:hypothetical protein